MKRATRHLLLLLAALAGVVLTVVAMGGWAPDSLIRLPTRQQVLERAAVDAGELGYRVEGAPRVQLSAGPRLYAPLKPFAALVQDESDPGRRMRRLHDSAPIRLAARFRTAVGPNGSRGDLVLEYDHEACLVGAFFGIDGLVMRGLPPPGGVYFADDIAEKMLRGTAPMRQESGLGGVTELIYQAGPGEPSVYVYLGANGGWIAQRQPAPSLLVSDQDRQIWSLRPEQQVELYAAAVLAFLFVTILMWRLAKRRAGFAQCAAPALLLALGLLPVLGRFEVETSVLVAMVVLYFLPQLAVLLVWIVSEAESREARLGSVEHWDRLARWRPVKATGRAVLIGLAFGCVLSGLVAASGRLAQPLGGGYGTYLLNLPDYWLLPTPLNRGLALAAGTAFLVGLGGRLVGKPGAILGSAVAGLGWAQLVPVAPTVPAWALGVAVSLAAGWALWWHGLLPLTVACVTGLSLPVAWTAWQIAPLMWPTALASSAPLLLLPLGLLLLWRAPQRGTLMEIEPAYVASLEYEARLEAEVALLRKLQLSLLPDQDLVERLEGIDVAWRMVPAEEVGGDFLDLMMDDQGRLWIAVADVAGHGISCSVLTAFAKAAVTEHAVAGVGPGTALQGIRRLFSRLRTRRSLVTLLLAVWDPASRALKVASAGHPPLLLCDDGQVREIGGPGMPLGVELPAEDLEMEVGCNSHVVLVASTDGVGEAMSPRDESFGFERWTSMLPELEDLSASEILGLLLQAVDDHRSGRPPTDDTTAIVLKV